MVWPSLYIAEGMRTWYVMLIGLAAEAVFVKLFLKETYLKSALIAFVMNFVSALLGIIAVPLLGILIEFIMIPVGTPTFHPAHWVVNYLAIVVLNALFEGLTVKIFFKHKFRKMFWWLCAANAASLVICILFHGFEMQKIMERVDF